MEHASTLFTTSGPQSASQLPQAQGQRPSERPDSCRSAAWISRSNSKPKDGTDAVKSAEKQWDQWKALKYITPCLSD